jgi:selenocysteine-specific translation elongation factor
MPFKGNVTAVIGRDLAHELGKKGTVSDVTMYNFKLQDSVLSFVEPSSYPDKVQSLVSALNMSQQVLLKVDALDAALAETIVALDALRMSSGYVIYGGAVKPETVRPLLLGTVVESYPVLEDQPMAVKERLRALEPGSGGSCVVQVDHSFQVKGVGTVALGVVLRGVVKRHDSLNVFPGKGKVLVKSIQVHDNDVEEAAASVRVGLALKDVKPDDVPRGSLLTTDASIAVSKSLELDASVSRFSPRPLGIGDAFLVNCRLNYAPARVVEGSVAPGKSGILRLELEREVPLFGGAVAFLDPGLKMPRVFGSGTVR